MVPIPIGAIHFRPSVVSNAHGAQEWAIRVHHRAASPSRQTQALTLGAGHDGLDRRLQRLEDSAPRAVGEGPFVVADDEDAPPAAKADPASSSCHKPIASARHASRAAFSIFPK
jgi:hypothetical protein